MSTIVDLGMTAVDTATFVDILVWFEGNGLYFEFKNKTQCIIEMEDIDAIALRLKFVLNR